MYMLAIWLALGLLLLLLLFGDCFVLLRCSSFALCPIQSRRRSPSVDVASLKIIPGIGIPMRP